MSRTDADHAKILSIFHFEAAEGTSVFGQCNLSLEFYAELSETVEVYLLASPNVDILGRSVASGRVAVEGWDADRRSGGCAGRVSSSCQSWESGVLTIVDGQDSLLQRQL